MLISKLLKKLQKDSWEKSDQRKSDRIKEFLPFITLCRSFQPIFPFLASNFAFYDRIFATNFFGLYQNTTLHPFPAWEAPF
jgi:hypothetical protein